MQIFLGVGLLLVGVPWILFMIFANQRFLAFVTDEWWMPIAFGCGVVGIISTGWFAAFQAFGTTTIAATRKELEVTRELGPIIVRKTLAAGLIDHFAQLKDGGLRGWWDNEPDSFPTWALVAHGGKRLSLLSRQPLDKSDWLGAELSEWFGVPFKIASSREE